MKKTYGYTPDQLQEGKNVDVFATEENSASVARKIKKMTGEAVCFIEGDLCWCDTKKKIVGNALNGKHKIQDLIDKVAEKAKTKKTGKKDECCGKKKSLKESLQDISEGAGVDPDDILTIEDKDELVGLVAGLADDSGALVVWTDDSVDGVDDIIDAATNSDLKPITIECAQDDDDDSDIDEDIQKAIDEAKEGDVIILMNFDLVTDETKDIVIKGIKTVPVICICGEDTLGDAIFEEGSDIEYAVYGTEEPEEKGAGDEGDGDDAAAGADNTDEGLDEGDAGISESVAQKFGKDTDLFAQFHASLNESDEDGDDKGDNGDGDDKGDNGDGDDKGGEGDGDDKDKDGDGDDKDGDDNDVQALTGYKITISKDNADKCKDEMVEAGIPEENITIIDDEEGDDAYIKVDAESTAELLDYLNGKGLSDEDINDLFSNAGSDITIEDIRAALEDEEGDGDHKEGDGDGGEGKGEGDDNDDFDFGDMGDIFGGTDDDSDDK